jgi:hypothetical protein
VFLGQQAASILACDFFTVETVWLKTLYVLFFIELNSWQVHVSGCTAKPDAVWVAQQARNLVLQRPELDGGRRFLVRDRDSKFTLAFDEVFRSAAGKVIRTPVKAPRANAYAERWVRTVRTECLDWLLLLNQTHLEHVLRVYVHHYNAERPQVEGDGGRRGGRLLRSERPGHHPPVTGERGAVHRHALLWSYAAIETLSRLLASAAPSVARGGVAGIREPGNTGEACQPEQISPICGRWIGSGRFTHSRRSDRGETSASSAGYGQTLIGESAKRSRSHCTDSKSRRRRDSC